MRVLIIEDDERMGALLQQGLTEEGHAVYRVHDGEEGVAVAMASSFDVVVLDVMLPRADGLTVARRLRLAANHTPILMLTARDSIHDVVRGLDMGADDYLTKPFAFEVLLARLRAVSRRGPIPHSVVLHCADLLVDTAQRRVTRAGRLINLTPREYGILELLLRNAGRPVSREVLLDTVWGFDSDVEENTLEAFVRLLRNKVDAPFDSKLIHTVRGLGYCIRVAET
ncbi:MAG: response regulator transcription factor [Acidobacteriaceae bacterium]|nr:response regulator transcription factor [Acidobacteriaceae bacterium]